MKTLKNTNQIAKVAFASVTFLFASLMPMQATSGETSASEMNEIQLASAELDMFNYEIEKAIAFTAPAVSDEAEAFELFVTESRLQDMFGSAAQAAAYVSPAVDDDFEVAVAMENLDSLNSEMEQSVKYIAE